MLLGAVAMLFGSVGAWAQVSIPKLDIETLQLDLGLVPQLAAGDDSLKTVVQVCAVALGVLAIVLTLTRVRGLGVLWRMLYLMTWLVLTGIALYLWSLVLADPTAILDDPSVSPLLKVGAAVLSGLERLGLVSVGPGLGLYALSVGSLLGLVGLCLPSGKSSTVIRPAGQVPHLAGPTAPAGWYPTPGGQRYWDGQVWR
jgi:hypothetical protein